ncbi:MAG: 50S ribosomal protein L24 [Legionellales bacterium]|nr:50S ribosomal protein L24 [Legionellales bacterium]
MRKIKTGDEVIVLTGKSKGARGRVLKVLAKNDETKVVVDGVNMVKKHVRANPNREQEGGIKEQPAALDVSNVALVNPKTNKADRVGFKTLENGTKVRYFKSTGEDIVE